MTPVISHLLWSLRPQFPILVWHVPCPKKSLPTCNLSARPVPCFGYKEADMTSQRFTFVNVTAPQDASSAGNKKRIRSAAAASGWAQGLRPKLPQTQLNASENPRFSYAVDLSDLFESSEKSIFSNTPASIDKQDPSAISESEPPSNHFSDRKFIWETNSDRKTSTAKSGATELDNRSRSNIKRKRTPHSSQTSSSRRRAPVTTSSASVSSQSLAASPTAAVSTWISSIQTPDPSLSTANSALASPHDLGSGIRDAFNCYPVQSQLWCDKILHHSKKQRFCVPGLSGC
jgi:hypothetical protein